MAGACVAAVELDTARDVLFCDVQAWVSDLAVRRGPVIVESAVHVVRNILEDAARDHMLVHNPTRGVKLPKRAPRRNTYLTASRLDMLANESGRYRSLVLPLGVGGLRWGEAAALRVSDIDFSVTASCCTVMPSRWVAGSRWGR